MVYRAGNIRVISVLIEFADSVFDGADVEKILIRINDGTWRIEDGNVRFFLLCGTSGAMLIDSGMNTPDARAIAESLTSLPVSLLNTHADPDHISGNRAFSSFYMSPAEEDLYRALVVSNLVSIHQKKYIGSLSAFCDAVSAGCGAGAGIAWLYDKDYDLVCRTITNTIGNVSGVVCDGAKSSCAAKIASAVDAAIMGFTLASRSQSFQPGDGVVKKDVEDTIKGIGYIGREGMKDTDVKILHMMIDS